MRSKSHQQVTANGITVIWDLVEVKARLRWTVWNSRCGQVQVLAAVRVVWSDLLIWRHIIALGDPVLSGYTAAINPLAVR